MPFPIVGKICHMEKVSVGSVMFWGLTYSCVHAREHDQYSFAVLQVMPVEACEKIKYDDQCQ